MSCCLLLFFLLLRTSSILGQEECIDNFLSNPFRNCTPNSQKCVRNGVCSKTFRVSVLHLEGYSSIFKKIFRDVLKYCCGDCANYTETYLDDTNRHRQTTDQETDIYHPVLGYTKQEQSHNYYFIPIQDIPVGYVFMNQPTATRTTVVLIETCLKLWPLGAIGLMMALIAGFFVWALETWSNVRQFPRPFLAGIFEGFWWSFISMTTVGYGDKYPRSCCARMFAVVWILIGITICSMFTASLTSAISTGVLGTYDYDMSGRQIGVLRNRNYDSLIVNRHGGIPIETQANVSNVHELVKMLKAGKVSGIFLDKYVAAKNNDLLKEYAKSELSYDGGQLSYGIQWTNKSDYVYFNRFIKKNRIPMEACIIKSQHSATLATLDNDFMVFSPNLFWKSFLGTGLIIAVICLFGCIYELKRKKGKWTRAPTCCRSKGDDDTGLKSPRFRRNSTTSSVKKMLNQTPEECFQLTINKDISKLIKKWKDEGTV